MTECFNAFSGYHVGDKLALVWGAEKDIVAHGRLGKLKRLFVSKYINKTIVLNSFSMTENDMLKFVNRINLFKPDYMLAYAQSANELAQYIKANDLVVHGFKGVITSAGTLFEDYRKTIEQVFHCKVYNRYGSRETGLMAMECECHDGLHINIFSQYIELVDEAGLNIPKNSNAEGRVIVTQLTNHAMPLIRYDIGDIAQWSTKECSCGRGLPLLRSVNGRTVNIFKKEDGTRIDGEYFTHLFYHLNYLKSFQVIQKKFTEIEVHLAPKEKLQAKDIESDLTILDEKIRLVMGKECNVHFLIVDEIKPTN